MNYGKIKILLLFTATMFFAACSSDNGGGGGPVDPPAASLSVFIDKSSVDVGEEVTFTARSGSNDVSSQAAYAVNGTAISGNKYSPASAGTYSVTATHDGKTSTAKSFTAVVPITEITLTTNTADILTGESFQFTVMSNTGVNVTTSSAFTANGSAISGATYTPGVEGTYDIVATYNGISSNVVQVTVTDPVPTAITLSSSNERPALNEEVTFTIMDDLGNDVTADSDIYVSGNLLSGNTFTAAETGVFDCYATYAGLTSPSTQIEYVVAFTQRVLVEDYTGTWCGYCPRVSHGLDLVDAQTEWAVPVAIHRGNDPWHYAAADPLLSLIGLTGYPTAMINRMEDWNYPEPSNVSQVTDQAGGSTYMGLSISSSISGSTIDATVKVKYSDDYSNQKIAVYLLQNGLPYNQVNYTSYYGGADPIVNFTHNHILRDHWTADIIGDTIPDQQAGDEFSISYTEALPSGVAPTADLEIVAFVIDATSNIVHNVQVAEVGTDSGYDLY